MDASRKLRISLAARWSLLIGVIVAGAVLLSQLFAYFFSNQIWLTSALTLLCMVPVVLLAVLAQIEPMLSIFRALSATVVSYRDGEFAFSLRWLHHDEIGDLVSAHNELGDVLRAQRLGLVQRELLLDTMVQNTPVAMLLVSDGGPVVFANLAARQMLNQGRKLEGQDVTQLLQQATPALREAIARGGDGLFTVGNSEQEEVYHLARRSFHLNGRAHELLLLRLLTTELRRQEVQTWKKVIRVISHELNNSLAPIASLANSGQELLRRGQQERLIEVLKTIEERARHLEGFILGYARFAKLPAPRMQRVEWDGLIAQLRTQIAFTLDGDLPTEMANFDQAQIEQALLNCLKNAHESGGASDQVALSVRHQQGMFRIDVMDRGTGMSETVLTNALVPFYSTKRSGTGLGLALTREIVEAHGGRITLTNREGGGLLVSLILPVTTA